MMRILLPAIAGWVCFEAFAFADERVRFQYKGLDEARRLILKKYADDFKSLSPPFRSSDRGIARIDLNGDGREDILAYFNHVVFCGSRGCRLTVLVATERGDWDEVMPYTVVPDNVHIENRVTNGLRDIRFGTSSRWAFDGKRYEYKKPAL